MPCCFGECGGGECLFRLCSDAVWGLYNSRVLRTGVRLFRHVCCRGVWNGRCCKGGLLLSSSRRVFFRIIKILLLEIFGLGFILLLLYCEICIYVFL